MDSWTEGYNMCLAGGDKARNPWAATDGWVLSQHNQWNKGFNCAAAKYPKEKEKTV